MSHPGRASGRAALEALADRAMADDLKRPKLSTLQAGLLLLQRPRAGADDATNWIFSAQMIALAQGLGLHADCQDWAIPEWEKSLRRRLGWTLYMQDRWGACVHGRPPLLSDDDWDLQVCTPADFPGPRDEAGVDGADLYLDTGAEVFIQHTELAQILTDVIRQFYATAATKPGGRLDRLGVVAAVDLAKPLMLRLRRWYAGLPDRLRLEPTEPRKLSANASLHVAHLAVEVALHRALVRLLSPAAPPDLAQAVRQAAKNRVQSAIGLVESLRPEHTGAFWGGSAAYQVATIGSLACLLWATSDSADEMRWCSGKLEDLRWVLRVRAQGATFIKAALRLIERDLDQSMLNYE